MGLVPGAMGHMAMEYTAPHSMDLMPMEGSIQEDRAEDGLGSWLEIFLPFASAYDLIIYGYCCQSICLLYIN